MPGKVSNPVNINKTAKYIVSAAGGADFSTIQAAVAALGTAEGTIFVRAGYYSATSTITLHTGQALVGEESSATTGVMLLSNITDGSPLIAIHAGDIYTRIENIFFTMGAGKDSEGIYIPASCTNITIRNCRFVDFNRSAIHTYDSFDHDITTCWFKNCGSTNYPCLWLDGVAAFGTNEVKTSKCQFEECQWVVVQIEATSVTNTFVQCKFHGPNPAVNIDYVRIISGSTNNKFIGCNFTGQGDSQSYVDCDGDRNIFEGNTIVNGGGIGLELNGNYCTANGNICNNNTGHDIVCTGSKNTISANYASNTIEASGTLNAIIGNAGGELLVSGNNNTFIGNNMTLYSITGLQCSGAQNSMAGLPFHWETAGLLAEVHGIDMKSVADTTLLVVPATRRVVLCHAVVINNATVGAGTAPIWNIGDNAATYNNYIGAATLAAVTSNHYEQRQTNNASILCYTNTTIKFRVSTAFDSTSMSCSVLLFGTDVAV